MPFVKAMPRWASDSPQFAGLKDDIRDNGIRHPLLIMADGRVVDGYTRLLAARAMQLREVPCQIVPDDEVQEIIVRELCRRRNLTKGQMAYVICPMLESAYLESLRRRAAGKKLDLSNSVGKVDGVKEWIELLGFSHELLRQARELHKYFDKYPEERADWEAKIFDPEKPVSIGAARAGIGGAGADQSKRAKGVEAKQLEFWDAPFAALKNAAPAWSKLGDDKQLAVLEEWRKTVKKLPEDLRQCMKQALEEAD